MDLNGHMNNTRYFDLVEDSVGLAAEGRELMGISTEYSSEARLGETLRLSWNRAEDEVYITGESEKPVFRMTLRYKPES